MASFTTFFDKNQLSNIKQSLIDSFKDFFPNAFVSSINRLLQAALVINSRQ